jgi:hypothetical protein
MKDRAIAAAVTAHEAQRAADAAHARMQTLAGKRKQAMRERWMRLQQEASRAHSTWVAALRDYAQAEGMV